MRCGFEFCTKTARWIAYRSDGSGIAMMTCAEHLGRWLASQTPTKGKAAQTTYVVHRALYPKKTAEPNDAAKGKVQGTVTIHATDESADSERSA